MKKLPLFWLLSGIFAFVYFVYQVRAQTAPPSPAVTGAGVSFDYSRGDYGFSSNTEVYLTSLNLSKEINHWTFRAAIPHETIKGPANVVGGEGSVAGAAARPSSSSASGLGDIVASADYLTGPLDAHGLKIDVEGRVKFATADEKKGLGTGSNDYYFQAGIFRPVGKVTPFGIFGYRFLGNAPGIELKDGFYASGGLVFPVSRQTSLGAALDWSDRITSMSERATDVSGFAVWNPTKSWRLTFYALAGFTDASPDFGGGGSLIYRF